MLCDCNGDGDHAFHFVEVAICALPATSRQARARFEYVNSYIGLAQSQGSQQ